MRSRVRFSVTFRCKVRLIVTTIVRVRVRFGFC